MSNLKTYRVGTDSAEVTLQVDLDVLTPELATEINTFWSRAEWRLQAEDGDVVRTVVRLFGAAAIRFFIAEGGGRVSHSSGGDSHWTEQVLEYQGEGWPDPGALGILILAANVFVVEFDEVTLEAV